MTEALRRVRNSRNEKSGARRRGHQVTSGNSSVYSDAENEMVEDEDTFTEAPWQQEETSEARALVRAARFISPKPTQNGMLNRLRTVSRVKQPS